MQGQAIEEKIPFQPLEPSRQVLVAIFLLVSVWYLTWRLGTFNRDAMFFSLALYGAELFGFFTALMHIFIVWRLTVRDPGPPPEGLSVDVFVTTYNEPVSLLRKTLLASRRLDYPHDTWLLDDGNRTEMRELALELGCRYLGRSDNVDAKAGNLNNALTRSRAEFIAVFDSDHAPKKNFLSKTLGYFREPGVAFVQTPQDFYNLDSFQHQIKNRTAMAWHEQSVFFRIIQRGKDYWNAAFFCGSCAVLRRRALDSIGGFATGTVTEDLHTSIKLHKQGFRSVFHAEPLAFGLAPSGVVPFLTQRIRWGQGAMQVWRQEGVFFHKGFTWAQRFSYLASSLTYFDGWQKGLFYIAPVIVLTTGTMPINAFGPEFLVRFIPYLILTFWVFEEVNRGYGRSVRNEQYNMVRFAAMAWSTLGLLRRKIGFSVTPKVNSPSAGSPLYFLPQTVLLVGNALAIPLGLFLFYRYQHLPASGLIANVLWSSANGLLALSVCLINMSYSKFRRVDYRFPISLPARIRFPGGDTHFGTIDDISSAGFRFYSMLPTNVSVGMDLSGEIFLPSGPVAFNAVIKALIEKKGAQDAYVKSVGCSFQWTGKNEQDRLDLFLYASDMQLSLNNFRETIHTPISMFKAMFSGVKTAVDSSPGHWNAVSYTSGDTMEPVMGLVSSPLPDADGKTLLSFAPVPEGTCLELEIYSRQGVTSECGIVAQSRQIDTPVSPVYLQRLDPVQEKISSKVQ